MSNPFDQFDGADTGASNPFDQFDSGAKPEKTNPLRRLVADPAISLLKGAIGVPEAAVGLADMVTGGQAGKLAEQVGFRPKEAKNILTEWMTPEQQTASRNVQEADGFVETMGQIAKNPSVVPHAVIESLPVMGAGGVAARALPAGSAVLRGALGEGAMGAGSAAEQLRQGNDDGLLTGKQAAAAAASGAGTAAFGALGGKVAQKLGIGDVDTMLAGGAQNIAGKKNVLRSALEGAVSEGALEEMPQSSWEQAAQNYGQDNPLLQGVGQAAAMGLVTGAAMGAGGGVAGMRYVQAQQEKKDAEANPSPEISGLLPAPAQTGIQSEQSLLTEVDRQNAVDAAQRNADAVYAERAAYEEAMKAIYPHGQPTITADVTTIQQDIDALLGIDQKALNDKQRKQYESALTAAFNEPIGIGHDANGLEIPVTMGDYLDNQVRAEQSAKALVAKRYATQQAEARSQQLADDETAIPQPSIPVVGPLSAIANQAVQSGATAQMQLQKAAEQAAKVAPKEQPKAAAEKAAPAVNPLSQIINPQGVENASQGPLQPGMPKGSAAQPIAAENVVQAPEVSNATQPEQVAQEAPPEVSPQARPASSTAPAAPAGQGAGNGGSAQAIDLSNRTEQQLAFLTQHGRNGHKEAAVAEIARRGVQIGSQKKSYVDAIEPVVQPLSQQDTVVAESQAPAKRNPLARWTPENLAKKLQEPGLTAKQEKLVRDEIRRRESESKAATKTEKHSGLSVGKAPGSAEAITVKNGVVHIGEYPAINYDTEADITVPDGATPQQIVDALKAGGAIASSQKIFGLKNESTIKEQSNSVQEKSESSQDGETKGDPLPALEEIATRLGITVSKSRSGFHAVSGGHMVVVPQEDRDAEGALSANHILAHELGHAILMRRGLNFKGIPARVITQNYVPNWIEFVGASRNFRPGVWSHENEYVRKHAKKPSEVLADAIASVLMGVNPVSMLNQFMDKTGTTLHDLGIKSLEKTNEEYQQKQQNEKVSQEASRESAPATETKPAEDSNGSGLRDGGEGVSAAADVAEPFERAGYRIYPTKIRAGNNVSEMWAVQSDENRQRASRGERELGGDQLFDDSESARKHAEFQAKSADERAEQERRQSELEAQEKVKADAIKADTMNGFLDGKPANVQALIRKGMEKKYNFGGKVMSVRQRVESLLSSGELKVSTIEEPRIKPMSRTQFNRADQRQQDAHERKMRDAGNKTVYLVGESDLGKNAHEYAKHLLEKADQNPIKKQEQPADVSKNPQNLSTSPEPVKETAKNDDWLGELFGQQALTQSADHTKPKAEVSAQDKADRVDVAIAMLTGEIEANDAAAAELAARKYKTNRKQIELAGDGPGKNGSMSVSAINESRKRRAIEARLNASSSIKQAIEFIAENPDSAFKQVADMVAAVTKQFNEGFFGPSANLDSQLDMAVGSLIGSGSYSGEGSAGRKLRMAAYAYATAGAKKPEAAKADEPKQSDSKATADAGDELTYNKRNRRTGGLKWDDIKDKNAALRVKEVVKSKVYPKPDYQSMVDGGMRDVVAHIIKQAYDGMAPAPKMRRGAEVTDAALQSYIAGVNRVMDGVMKWANDGTAVAKWANAQSKLSGGSFSISEIATSDTLLDTVYPGGWKTHREEIIMLGGNKMLSALQPGHDEVGRALKDIKLGWPAKSESWQKQGYKVVNAETINVDLYAKPGRGDSAAYVSGMVTAGSQQIDSFIVRGTADKESQEVQDAIAEKRKQLEGNYVLVDKSGRMEGVYPAEDSAIEAAREKVKREAKDGEVKEAGRKVSEVDRVGIEHRLPGDDVTTERLKETFGFRGVNFGNWMKGDTNAKTAERQLHLNHLFDAFMDLAKLINVPPKAMSLNGMLGIAVGAQGSGKAWAHFVPGVNEINVTRTNGAGALAHEWGHALDHYFATMGGLDRNKEPYLSAHVGTLTGRVDNGRYVRSPIELANVRPEVAAQFQSIVETMTKRKETDAEYEARISGDKDIAGRMVAEEIKKITEDIDQAKTGWGTPAVAAKIRGLAERMAVLDYGDGRVSMGGDEVPAVVAEIADAYKEASGVPLKNVSMLGYYADHYRAMSGILESTKERAHREIQTDYKNASNAADAKKKPYWSTKLEMFARAFDAYVVDSLAEKAAENTYLAGIEAVAPQGDERKAIDKAFDFLFAELKTKETEQGTALYSVASFTPSTKPKGMDKAAVESVIAPVVANWKYGTVTVVQSQSELPSGAQPLNSLSSDEIANRRNLSQKLRTIAGQATGRATESHEHDAAALASMLAKELGLPETWKVNLVQAAGVHDIGKRDIPEEILLADRKLTAEEFTKVKRHPGAGAKMLRESGIPEAIISIVQDHHRQPGGKGYPVSDAYLSFSAQIMRVADVVASTGTVDAGHPYGHDNGLAKARKILSEDPSFNPEIVAAFNKLADAGRLPAAFNRGFIEGAYAYNGQIYLVAENFKSPDRVLQVLAHEAVGHMAMEELTDPAEYARALNSIKKLATTNDQWKAMARHVDRVQPGLDEMTRAKEILARSAETGQYKNIPLLRRFVDSVVAKVKAALRHFFKGLWINQMTEGEIFRMLRIGEQRLAQGGFKPNPQGGSLAMASKNSAFWKWFGDSKVVDAEGKPLVVYHGTSSRDITEFRPSGGEEGEWQKALEHFKKAQENNERYGYMNFRSGTFFSPDPDYAGNYTAENTGVMYPVYIKAENPIYFDQRTKKVTGVNPNKTPDALIMIDGDKINEIAVIDPTQIKSSVGNNGDFDGNNPNILFSTAAAADWGVSEPSNIDNVIYAMQDKHIDTKRVVQAIMAAGKKLSDDINPYLQEELFHGRAAKGVKDFLDFELRPLLADMQKAKVDMGDFEEYLWNRHAQERNEQIAKVNPDMKDGGSGIKTADAKAYLSGLPAERRATFESLAAKVDAMNRNSQTILVGSGLEKQSTIDAWNGAYKHYVPLQREDVETGHVGTGKGFSVRGSASKRAMGSGRSVVDIIANLTMQREMNIVRAEKNRVSNALAGLAATNPNEDFWTFDKAPKERVVQETAIYTVLDESGKKIDEFTRLADAERLANKTDGATIDQTWDDRVTERVVPGFTSRDNVVLTRINGEDHYIIFNEKNERAMRMATALKNLDADNLGRVLSIVGKATRYLASVNTQYNPVFGVINLIRDAQGALINLSSTPLAGEQKKVLGYTVGALRGIYADIRAHRKGQKPSSAWAALFEEFQKEGGQTGYRDAYANAEARAEAIKSELAQAGEGKAKQFTRGLFGWLSDYNETMENAVRLAAYKAATEKGMSKQQAASLAKNITVNFNRKGQMATQVGAMYAFFNASVQGTARISETLFEQHGGDLKNIRLSKKGKQIVMGGILLGSMQAMLLAAAGFDDDEPPEFVRERNLILPIGDGKYLTLAMPLGLHVIPGIGRIATEFMLSGGKDPIKRLAQFGSMFAEAFNPVGNSGFSLQTITPSVVDPFAALAENRDFTGKEIYREDFNKLNPTPGHARAKDVSTWYAKLISESINYMTGGTEFKPGVASWSPDAIDYLISQAGGGVMREVNKVSQTIGAGAIGEELPLYKVPLIGRFIGDTEGQSGQSQKFYAALKQINMHEAQYKGLLEDGRRDEAMEYLEENPAVRMMMPANYAERIVSKLRSTKRDLIERDADKEQVKAIDEKISLVMKTFNERTKAFTL